MIQKTINCYTFDELPEEGKKIAINDHIDFWCECREYNKEHKGNYEKAIDEAERMQTPWFIGSYIYDYCLNEIIQDIRMNEYLFTEDGCITSK